LKDNPFGESTGAAIIFGVTGGVMEAALRTAADVLSGKNLENVEYNSVRGLSGIKESTVKLGPNDKIELKVAVSHQMRNVRDFLAQIEEGEKSYHFIEISKSWNVPFSPPKVIISVLSMALIYSHSFFLLSHSDMSWWLYRGRRHATEPRS
jgi:Iron only hydrogenase large subunit, C-terminal domain